MPTTRPPFKTGHNHTHKIHSTLHQQRYAGLFCVFVLGRAGGGRWGDLLSPPCVVRWIVDEWSDKESLGALGADTLHPTQKQRSQGAFQELGEWRESLTEAGTVGLDNIGDMALECVYWG